MFVYLRPLLLNIISIAFVSAQASGGGGGGRVFDELFIPIVLPTLLLVWIFKCMYRTLCCCENNVEKCCGIEQQEQTVELQNIKIHENCGISDEVAMMNEFDMVTSHIRQHLQDGIVTFNPCNGNWSGNYTGTSWRNNGTFPTSVRFMFQHEEGNGNMIGKITGEQGQDQVGAYTMNGSYHIISRRVTLIKTYATQTDRVRYTGTFTAENEMNGTWTLREGTTGTWKLKHKTPTYEPIKSAQTDKKKDVLLSIKTDAVISQTPMHGTA